jgi:hypothetical protein
MLFNSTLQEEYDNLVVLDETIHITAHDEDVKLFLNNALRNRQFSKILKNGESRESTFEQPLLETFVQIPRKKPVIPPPAMRLSCLKSHQFLACN